MANKIKIDAQDVMQKTAQAAEMAEEKPQAGKVVRSRAKKNR